MQLSFVNLSYEPPVVTAIFKEGAQIDVPEIRALIKACAQLSNNKPYLLYSELKGYISASSAARETASSFEESQLVLANAIVINSLPLKLIADFFARFNKPYYPAKVFTDGATAKAWLMQFAK